MGQLCIEPFQGDVPNHNGNYLQLSCSVWNRFDDSTQNFAALGLQLLLQALGELFDCGVADIEAGERCEPTNRVAQ